MLSRMQCPRTSLTLLKVFPASSTSNGGHCTEACAVCLKEWLCPGGHLSGVCAGVTCSRGTFVLLSRWWLCPVSMRWLTADAAADIAVADRRRSEQQFSRVDTAPCCCRLAFRAPNAKQQQLQRQKSSQLARVIDDRSPASAWRRVDPVAVVVIDRIQPPICGQLALLSQSARVSGHYSVCRSWVAVR